MLFGLLALAASAGACPVCDSLTGEQVRAALFDEHFLRTLLLVLLPFPVLGGAVVATYLGVPDLHEAETAGVPPRARR